MPQSFASLHCHIVFSTKHRQPKITPDLQPRLFEYIGGILRNHSACLVAAGGMPDHIHLLVSLGRTLSVADTVRLIKSNSSAWLHDELKMCRLRVASRLRSIRRQLFESRRGEIVSRQSGRTSPPPKLPRRILGATPPPQPGMGRPLHLGLTPRSPPWGSIGFAASTRGFHPWENDYLTTQAPTGR